MIFWFVLARAFECAGIKANVGSKRYMVLVFNHYATPLLKLQVKVSSDPGQIKVLLP